MEIVWVAAGGCLGAISRFVAVTFISRRVSASFPYGTITVNLLGSLLLGLLYGLGTATSLLLLAGVGFLGSFTTFSTFQFEIVELQQARKKRIAFRYIVLSILGGLVLAFLGFGAGRLVTSS